MAESSVGQKVVQLAADERLEPLGSGITAVISPDHGFGTDAMLLAHFADPKRTKPCLDLGTGCGIIPLLWKRNGVTADIYGLEIQEKGYQQFSKGIALSNPEHHDSNSAQTGTMDNVHAILGDLRDIGTDLPEDSPLKDLKAGSFKTVTMNPPYKPVNTGILSTADAEQIARHETLCTLEDAAKAASWLLNFGGTFCICHRPERLADAMEAFRNHKLEPKRLRFVQKQKDTAPWLFLLEGRKGGKPYLNVLPPLLIQKEDGTDSDELIQILGEYTND